MIPKKVEIGGFVYDVIIDTSESFGSIGTSEINWGKCDHVKAKITLNGNACQQQQEDTFIHEIVHSICNTLGDTMTEDFVVRFSHLLYQVLKDNNITFTKDKL